ncbi:glycosyltransferase [Enterovirga aerilata]|uniref:Glycosyltransferase n=1 Tax=Enterovirga aerilata TaxID=2730920 RepID=A0A849IDF9_9HYPH|nr:glycosyltransferase [Enterovirga sp. DB1703]NNM74080.1 glycosyltransferase [Enterovirga sp. DB1703]
MMIRPAWPEAGPHQRTRTSEQPPAATRRLVEVRHLVFDTSDAHPSEANGVHRVARHLAVEQAAAGHDTRLVILSAVPEGARTGRLEVPSQILPIVGPSVRGKHYRLAPEILETLVAGAERRTFFHIHGAREPLLLPVCRALNRAGIPYAVTVHGRYSHLVEMPGLRRGLSRLYLHLCERRALERAQFVQAVSERERMIIARIAPASRIKVVPNAAFSLALDGRLPVPLRRASSRAPLRFGYLGRYAIEHKGLDILLRGFARYRRQGGTGELELFGTGPARKEIADLARELDLGSCVRIGAALFGDGKARAFGRWDYFVQPSRYEGSPIGALEAALSGLPLLVTPGTGLLEDVERLGAGIPVRHPSAESLAAALMAAERASPADRNLMSRHAHEMVIGFGDWGEISSRLLGLYGS